MIKYYGGAYGLQILLRLHGSAVFKSLTPALLSTAIYVILWHFYVKNQQQDILEHPYPMGALLVAFSFLLTFKMSFSYDRVRPNR
jgi:predicted membrane chloride channel (bestrophin family)